MTITGDKLRGHLETMVLSVLERVEAHGLEIIHRLEADGCGLRRARFTPPCTGLKLPGRSRLFEKRGRKPGEALAAAFIA